jgi:hypothetical protein
LKYFHDQKIALQEILKEEKGKGKKEKMFSRQKQNEIRKLNLHFEKMGGHGKSDGLWCKIS